MKTSKVYHDGLSLMARGRHSDALEAFETAINTGPSQFPEARLQYSICLIETGQLEAAVNNLLAITDQDPNNLQAYHFLAHTYGLCGQLEDAKGVLLLALNRGLQNYWTHAKLGAIFFQTGDLDSSLCHYLMAILLNPDYRVAKVNLAVIHYKKGDLGEAAEGLERCLALEPSDTVTRVNLINLYTRKGLGKEHRIPELFKGFSRNQFLTTYSA